MSDQKRMCGVDRNSPRRTVDDDDDLLMLVTELDGTVVSEFRRARSTSDEARESEQR